MRPRLLVVILQKKNMQTTIWLRSAKCLTKQKMPTSGGDIRCSIVCALVWHRRKEGSGEGRGSPSGRPATDSNL